MTDTPESLTDSDNGTASFRIVKAVEVGTAGVNAVAVFLEFETGSTTEGLPQAVRFVLPAGDADRFARLVLSQAASLQTPPDNQKAH